jgi:hypothetical protein
MFRNTTAHEACQLANEQGERRGFVVCCIVGTPKAR